MCGWYKAGTRPGSEASARLCSLLGAALTVGSQFSKGIARAPGGLDGNGASIATNTHTLSVCRGCGAGRAWE